MSTDRDSRGSIHEPSSMLISTRRVHAFAAADVKFAPQRISSEELAGLVDAVFIALHGRPGEDGTLQQELLKLFLDLIVVKAPTLTRPVHLLNRF